MNMERLISEVEQRPALWDVTNPGHGDHMERRFQWVGVALEMGANVHLCRHKWQSLRRSYQRWLILQNQWIHAEAMQFLGNGNRAEADNAENLQEEQHENDDNYYFVISLLTRMRRMTPLQNVSFRTKVMEAMLHTMKHPPVELQEQQ